MLIGIEVERTRLGGGACFLRMVCRLHAELGKVESECGSDCRWVKSHDFSSAQCGRDLITVGPVVNRARRNLEHLSDLLSGCERRQYAYTCLDASYGRGSFSKFAVVARHGRSDRGRAPTSQTVDCPKSLKISMLECIL